VPNTNNAARLIARV